MSAQRGFFSEAGSHKPFDERSAWIFSEAGSHKPFDERSAWIFVRSWFAQAILVSAQHGFFIWRGCWIDMSMSAVNK